jgi:uncharacterized protein (DUF1330 family)
MKSRYAFALATAGFALGAAAVQGLHAQTPPPVYYIQQIEVSNVEAYTKEYVPRARDSIKAAGGRILSAGAKLTTIEGDPPKQRIAVLIWDSVEKMQAWRQSAQFKEARAIGDKYGKFHAFTVEGVVQ